MARRDERECAWCARDLRGDDGRIGKDWKVYCSVNCAEAGEEMMDEEARRRCPAQQPPSAARVDGFL
jgi:hypothetical protein